MPYHFPAILIAVYRIPENALSFFPLLFPCSPFYLLVSPSTEFPRNPLPLCFQRLSVLQCTGSLHLNIRTNLALKLENRVRIEDSCCQVGVVSPLQTALLGHQGQRAAVVQQQQHNRPLLPPPPPLMDQQARSQYHLMEVTTGAMVAGSDHQHHLHQLTAQQQQQHSVALYTSSTATQQQTLATGGGGSNNAALPPISSFKPSLQKDPPTATATTVSRSIVLPQETAETVVNFFELYSELGKDNYAKMTTCSYCGRRFRFVSVLLVHLRCHVGVASVEKVVEMKMKIWVKRGSLRCGRQGCPKQKYAYTLDYAQHRDSHEYAGLVCDVCGVAQGAPLSYAGHLSEEHEAYLYQTETQVEDIPPLVPTDVVNNTEAPAVMTNATIALSPSMSVGDASSTVDTVCSSPQLSYQPRSVGPPTSSASLNLPPLHIMDVKTPKSAPPVIADFSPIPPSPQGGQQPMSAPSLYNGDGMGLDYSGSSVDLDHLDNHHHPSHHQQSNSMPSMPCLVGGDEEEAAQNPPVPDVVNNQQQQPDSEDIMDILKDIEALGRTFKISFLYFTSCVGVAQRSPPTHVFDYVRGLFNLKSAMWLVS